jgi:SHS2 domain-containing protein
MRNFELLPHTADLRLRVEGDTLANLFSAALEGMAEVIKPGGCKSQIARLPSSCRRQVGQAKRKAREMAFTLSLTARNSTQLLIDFLSEVLTRSHEEKAVFCRIEFAELGESSLKAEIFGLETDGFNEDIKGVTYHEAKIQKNSKGDYETTFVF